MSLKFILPCILSLFLLLLSVAVKAETDAHVHGLATLMMALEGDVVEIQLESPAANILGFEYKATTAEEIHAAEDAEALLESPQSLFSFFGSSCELQDIAVDFSSVMDGGHHDEHHDDHESHEDEDEHHGEHEESADAHEEHNDHSEITANYHFTCDSVTKISAVSVALFEQFPGLEKINAMWVTETQQGAEILTAESTNISLR